MFFCGKVVIARDFSNFREVFFQFTNIKLSTELLNKVAIQKMTDDIFLCFSPSVFSTDVNTG